MNFALLPAIVVFQIGHVLSLRVSMQMPKETPGYEVSPSKMPEGFSQIVQKINDQGGNLTAFHHDLAIGKESYFSHKLFYSNTPGGPANLTLGRAEPATHTAHSVSKYANRYGFFMQVGDESLAVQNILSTVRKYYQNEKFILYSDRSLDYSGMCLRYNCSFAHAGVKAGIWGDEGSGPRFLRRLVSAMHACECDILVLLEDDTCINGKIEQEPLGDIGGLPWPHFEDKFVSYAAAMSGVIPHRPAVWGCTGGCYFRVDSLLSAFQKIPGVLNASSTGGEDLMEHIGKEKSKFGDVYPVAAAMIAGASVVPWSETSEGGLFYDQITGVTRSESTSTKKKTLKRPIEHKCKEQLALRGRQSSHELACPVSEAILNSLNEDGVLLPPDQVHPISCELR